MVPFVFVVFVFMAVFPRETSANPAPAPVLQSPAPGALNVDPDSALSWRWVDDLLANGSFESGLDPGWTLGGVTPGVWYIRTETTNAYGMGYRRASTFMPFASQVSAQLVQPIYIPADATSATLQWSERIANQRPYNFPQIGFMRVQLYQDLSPIATLDTGYGGEPQFIGQNWVSHTTNLVAYAGQSVLLVIEANASPPYSQDWLFEVDGFSLACDYPSGTPECLVFLGKNAVLDATNLVGDVFALSLNPPPLDPLTTYYWRVGAVREGVTNFSDTAHFTTGQRVVPALAPASLTASGVRLSFPSRTNRTYTVEQIDALDATGFWYDVLFVGPGTGGLMEVEVPRPLSDAAFWRLRETQ